MSLIIRQVDANDEQRILAYELVRDDAVKKIMQVESPYKREDLGCVFAAESNGVCVGGISFHSGVLGRDRLPIDGCGIDVLSIPELPCKSKVCQFTGLAVRFDIHEKAVIAAKLIRKATEYAMETGCEEIVVWAPKVHTRLYKKIFHRLGFDLVVCDVKPLCTGSKIDRFQNRISKVSLQADTIVRVA